MRALPGGWHVRRLGRALGRALLRRSHHGIVLLYHRVAGPRRDPLALDVRPAHFDAQLAVLARTAAPLALDEFETRRRAGTLPPRAVAVTCDDGYADSLLTAAPILARHGVPATIFVTAGMVGSDREFWWDLVERIAFSPHALGGGVPGLAMPWGAADGAPPAAGTVAGTAPDRWSVLAPDDPTPRHRLFRALHAALYAAAPASRDASLDEWRAWARVSGPARESHRALTLRELETLATSPGITIGAHTMTHPMLSALPPAEQRREVAGSGVWLAHALGRPVDAFAYPFGTRAEVSASTIRAVRQGGFRYAMANEPRAAWRWSSRWRLPRFVVRDWDAETFARHLEEWFAQ
ncbi:MAG TPA: polysaccharide deacetylase family protein [Gemmatimonadaceae bacterium]|nr:polysaccharide deacetylase family protein [Gemmatimonadaceae bacterium]